MAVVVVTLISHVVLRRRLFMYGCGYCYLEITRGVEEQIRRLQISMKHVSGVNVLETTENLIQEVADVIVTQSLKGERNFLS